MDKLAYIGVINHDENVEYPLNFSSDGIYEVVCKFYGGCEIKIKSSNYIDAHEIHKDYYKFHINVFLPIIGLIGLVYGVKEKDKLFMALNILLILLLPITMFVGHLVGSP